VAGREPDGEWEERTEARERREAMATMENFILTGRMFE
jgi:hypothetical protein